MANTQARAVARQSRYPRSLVDQSPELQPSNFNKRMSNIRSHYPELLAKIHTLESRIKEVEDENREVKENLDFVSVETDLLTETLKETEELLRKEKQDGVNLREELKACRELLACKDEQLEKAIGALKETEEFLRKEKQDGVLLRQELTECVELIASKEDQLKKFESKYTRNRQVWEENEKKANEEIKMLDDVIDRVVQTLTCNEDALKTFPALKELLLELTQDQIPSINNLSSTFV